MDDQDCAYQCKLCESKFKTTAELQKHKRLNHRNSTTTATTKSDEKIALKPERKPSPSSVAKIKVKVAEEVSGDGTGHRHGTRYSKARNIRNDEISFGKCRHLTCESCSHNFDTKDPVVVHLLRQSLNDNGTTKCPFCTKVLLEDCRSSIKGATTNGANSKNEQKVDVSSSIIPPKDNLNNKRKSRGSLGSGEGNAKKISSVKVEPVSPETTVKSSEVPSKWKVAAIPLVRQPSLRVQQNRKQSSPVEATTTTPPKKLYKPKPSPSTPVSAVKVREPSAESTSTVGLVPVRSDQVKHSYEITYRQSHGKGSRGGSLGGQRKSRSSGMSEGDSTSSAETPLKVSVLINNNPYPSDKRLAVPKGKQFQKGDIRCPYCGFEAKSVREIQFHVNTHMAKSYPCEFCSHIYRSKQAVMNHTQKHHPNEYNNLKDQSSDINRSTVSVDMEADDQQSMSNYSSSMTSDSTETVENFYKVNQSQESNLENNSNFPVTATYTSYYAPEVHHGNGTSYGNDQAYFHSAVGALLVEQQTERDFFMVGQPVSVERVVEMANF